jgi:hypothetical protein
MGLSSWLRLWRAGRAPRGSAQRRSAAPRFRPRVEALEDRWLPSQVSLVVTSLADTAPGTPPAPGTLRAAIQTADAGSHSDKFTINFAVAGTIDLQSPLPSLTNNINIDGPGASSLTVERAAGATFPSGSGGMFFVTPQTTPGGAAGGPTVTISGLTVANSDDTGVGVYDYCTLTLTNCKVVNNSDGPADFGAGIFNQGVLTISGCTISGNSAIQGGDSGQGGGITNYGTMTITGSTVISGNTAKAGGGILNGGSATVSGNTTISGNSATFQGGGIWNGGTATMMVIASTISGNSAAYGGGIYNRGPLTIADSTTISGNSATYGGGIYNANNFGAGSVTVHDSVLTGNSATDGGAIYNDAGTTLDVKGSSTLSGNTASASGGGIYNLGTATLEDCTLSGNTAGSAGGGIFNAASGTLTIDDSTVLTNVAPLGDDLYNLGYATLNDSTVGVIGP